MQKKMKFLLFSEMFPSFKGGAENHIFRIGKELQKRGHEVVACVADDEKHVGSEEAGFEVLKIPSGDNKFIRIYKEYTKLSDKEKVNAKKVISEIFNKVIRDLGKPDVVITHMYWSFLFKEDLLNLGVPTIFISHNGRTYPEYDMTLYNSKYSMNNKKIKKGSDFVKSMIDPSKDFVCYPICLPYTRKVSTSGEFQVGQIKLISHKGPETFYDLADKFPMFNFLAVRGEWEWTDKVEEGHANVKFVKPVRDMSDDFFSKIEVYLHFAYYEDFGMTPLEAMGHGIPVVGKGIMGLKESIGWGGVITRDPDIEVGKLLTNRDYYNEVRGRQFRYIKEMHNKTMNQYDAWLKRLEELL